MSDLPLISDVKRTALVLVDLQMFIVEHPTEPLTGREVLANAVRLADAARAAGIRVVLIRVGGGEVSLRPPTDLGYAPMNFPPNAHDFPEELGPKPGDIVVTKYQMGAFYGTDLDVQLRRRGIDTIILGGMASAYGLEATARQAHERNYAQVIVSDAMAGFTRAEHDNALAEVLPRIGRIRTTDQVIAAIPAE